MKIGLVCSHGGHLTELLELQSAWEGHETFYITYHSKRVLPGRTFTYGNLTEKPLRVIPMFFSVLRLLARERPDWIISNGAEIAIPVFFAAWLLGIKTMYIEASCRVKTSSFTGRIVYPITKEFLVQWPELLTVYGPKARYEGGML
jgi:beta-1,4-N-acetylglucosaminyltransferase